MNRKGLLHLKTGGAVADMKGMQAPLGFVQTEQNMNRTEGGCGAAGPGRRGTNSEPDWLAEGR